MKYNNTMFPAQKLSIKKKNKEWGEACVDYIIGMGEVVPNGSDKTAFEDMQTYYNLYNSIFDEKDLLYVSNPFNQEDGFPANPQMFNIIKSKIDLLLGEETKHPFNFRIVRTSQDASSEVQDKMKQLMVDYLMATIMAGMSEKQATEYQEKLSTGELLPPEKISSFITRDYKDIAESCAYHSLNYLKEKLNLDHEYFKGWKDALIVGKEVYYNGIINGEPNTEHVNPMYFNHDMSPDMEFIEDGDWCVRRMRMSYTEVYDRLYDKMTEKQLDELLELSGEVSKETNNYGPMKNSNMDYAHLDMTNITNSEDAGYNSSNLVNLWHVCWRSYRKIGFITVLDEVGQEQKMTVSEDYMVVGNELNIDWKWVIDVWEGYKIGDDMYVGVQPLEYQYISKDNMNSQKLPYSGVIYNNTNSPSKSLVAIMKPLQYMYIIVWYRLELALARDKGKVITMDITQIPKSMNIDAAKWMHYLSSVGVNFVNPYEDGWDIPGREGGKPSQFNQISALDLTMASTIDQYINLMSKIEDMVSEISGISRQRQGEITPSELVGNVSAAQSASASITEPLFWMHNQAKKNSLKILLNTAKETWKDSKRTNIQYVMDDSTRTFMDLSESFFYEDYDLFISDSTKDKQNLEVIRGLYQPAMQNGATLLDVAEIMTLENVTSIKEKLSQIEDNRSKREQAQADAENQRQMQLIQVQNETKQQAIQLDQQKIELEKYKIDSDNQTRVTVAEIGSYRGQAELDQDQNGIPDIMEIADLSLKRSQHEADVMDKEMQVNQKEREATLKHKIEKDKIESQKDIEKAKLSMESQKIKLENKKLEYQKQIQQIKDNAAMDREKLKASTALKNKVSGQK